MNTRSTPFRLPWKKRILTHPSFQAFVTWLMASLIKCCWQTCRIEWQTDPATLPYLASEASGIFCFWHGRMIIFPCVKPKKRVMHVLISHHRDGELIAKVISHFRIKSVRGSSTHGAREATRNLIRLLADGDNISITPDGPRGPRYVAQEGAATLSRLSKKPMIPVSFSASRCRRFKSWDRFMIPLPFARVMVIAAAPIHGFRPDDQPSIETLNAELQSVLYGITCQADEVMGQTP